MIKYRRIDLDRCMTVEELDAQWVEGYELVSVAGSAYAYAYAYDENFSPRTREIEGPEAMYCHYFKYTGGVRIGRSVVGRGS